MCFVVEECVREEARFLGGCEQEGFFEKIGKVELPLAPINFILPLGDCVTDPMVPHVDGYGRPLGHRASGEADGPCVVAGDKDEWLRV